MLLLNVFLLCTGIASIAKYATMDGTNWPYVVIGALTIGTYLGLQEHRLRKS